MFIHYLYNVCEVIFNVISLSLSPTSIIILLLWVVVLFKESNRLKKKAKYSTLSSYNQDASLQALNSKVEYRKSLFLIAIVLSELVFHILTVIASIEVLSNEVTNFSKQNITGTLINTYNSTEFDCKKYDVVSNSGQYANNGLIRIILLCFPIPLVITFSLVYTLMSYYVMVTKKSLNYNPSLESVNLSRGQKILLLISFGACISLFVTLLRAEVHIIFQLVNWSIFLAQLIITRNYRRKLVRVINWKILDTKIAFGTDHHLFKYYTKSLNNYKSFILIFLVLIFSLWVFVTLQSIRGFIAFSDAKTLYNLYGICLQQSHTQESYIKNAVLLIHMIEQIPLVIVYILLFILNLLTIPYLLRKINSRWHFSFRFLPFSGNKDLYRPLLKK